MSRAVVRRSLAASFAIMVLLACSSFANVTVHALAMGSTNTSDNAISSVDGSVPPPPTDGAGCHTYIVSDAAAGWQSIACAPQTPSPPHPMEGGGYGIEGVYGGPSSTYYGQVTVDFSQFTGESDSSEGNNDWSIQVNTNQWVGSNGYTDEVQFTEQNYPTYLTFFGYAEACVWEVVVTTQLYAHFCVSTSIQSLSSSFDNYVFGYIYTSGGTTYLEVEYCQVGTQCWSDSTPDGYGLYGNWQTVDGTILGEGNGSTADFTSPTSLTATVYLDATSSFSGGGSLQGDTDEENNLSPGTPSSSCPGYYCEVSTSSSN